MTLYEELDNRLKKIRLIQHVNSPENLHIYVEINIEELEMYLKQLESEIKKIKRDRLINRFLIFDKIPDQYYQDLIDIYYKYISLENAYIEIFKRIRFLISKNNSSSLAKLFELGLDLHNETVQYLTFKEDEIEHKRLRIKSVKNPYEDHYEDYINYLNNKLLSYSSDKVVVKEKKMC